MKKRKINWSRILLIVVFAGLFAFVGLMYQRLTELTNQIAYLQDSANIIITDVDGLETNIAQTLEAETGLVEDYSIEIVDMNFTAKTCEVAISVIPKEYTDSTKLSVFFGTKECPLEKDGYEYTGSAVLPLAEDFGGNLTFLFADGKKKNTEVYRNYSGIQHKLDQVLSGSMTVEPKYRDGTLSLADTVEYALDGVGLYEFSSAELVAEYGNKTLLRQDLMESWTREQETDTAEGASAMGAEPEGTEAPAGATGFYPISGISGTAELALEFEPESGAELRVFLRAKTTDGYRFMYTLFSCTLSEDSAVSEGEKTLALDTESFDFKPRYVVYDKRGGKLVLD
ncbi:MAG: hypothetical protein NC355_10510 [Blautia sp.]|nr:hypothetical protein [Blautia sp.]